ncbi:MAG: hypothetical protein ACLPX5_00625 [Dissulfurispiraceae bacterium]
MRLYIAFDLHARISYLAIIDEAGKRVMDEKLPNLPEIILNALGSLKRDLKQILCPKHLAAFSARMKRVGTSTVNDERARHFPPGDINYYEEVSLLC